MDRPQVNWHVALYKTVQISLNCKKPVNDVWHILVDQAKSKTKTSSSIRDSERNQAKKDTKDRNVTSKFTKHLEIVRMAP